MNSYNVEIGQSKYPIMFTRVRIHLRALLWKHPACNCIYMSEFHINFWLYRNERPQSFYIARSHGLNKTCNPGLTYMGATSLVILLLCDDARKPARDGPPSRIIPPHNTTYIHTLLTDIAFNFFFFFCSGATLTFKMLFKC